MTLILTVTCPAYIVQVSDRLLTMRHRDGRREFDPVANKTVVFRASDALVTLGYSGDAYLNGTPTDEWLAERLHGKPLPRWDGQPVTCLGAWTTRTDLGLAMERLRREIAALPLGAVRNGLFVTIAGWQGRRRNIRPTVIEIERCRGSTSLQRAPRIWDSSKNFRLYGIGAQTDVRQYRALTQPFRAGGHLRCAPDQMETVLCSLIRSTSLKQATVGSHLLSVILMRPGLGPSGCRFLPMSPHLASLTGSSIGARTVAVAHTPWIVGGGMLHPPSLEIGSFEILLAGVPFRVQGAPAAQGIVGLSSSIRRPAHPGHR
jgi:hypothetical protein